MLKVLISQCLSNIASDHTSDDGMKAARKLITEAVNNISQFVKIASKKDDVFLQSAARDFSYSLARTYVGELLYK